MALFDPDALNPGVSRREVAAWAGYDFANSGYTTVVLTTVYSQFFVGVVAAGTAHPTAVWTWVLAISNALVLLLSPLVGAYADLRAKKKALLFASTVGCVIGTVLLAWPGPGDVFAASAALVLSNLCFMLGMALVAAFLPELAKPEALGKVSGWGWAFGYVGGLLTLGLCLAYVIWARGKGQTAAQFVPVTMWLTAGVFALAATPTFLVLRERAQAQRDAAVGGTVAASFARLGATLRQWRRYRDFMVLLACGACYQAGVTVVIALAAIYASDVMKFSFEQTMGLILAVNITAAIGAFTFGYVQDRLGHRLTLALTLVGWIAMVAIAASSPDVVWFWVAANLAGLCMGSSQSAGRALAGALAPRDRLAEFYGLWMLATQVASIVGPLVYGAVMIATGNAHRIAIAITGAFFVAGLLLLALIDVERGRRAALVATPA
jgi:UMF1 family MFS transporter